MTVVSFPTPGSHVTSRRLEQRRTWLVRGFAFALGAPLLIGEIMLNREIHPAWDAIGVVTTALPIAACTAILLREIVHFGRGALLVLGIMLSLVSIGNSVMRQNEVSEAKLDVITTANTARQAAETELARLRDAVTVNAAAIQEQCVSTRPGPQCKAARALATDLAVQATAQQARVDAMPPYTTAVIGKGEIGDRIDTVLLAHGAQIWLIALLMNLGPMLAGSYVLYGVVEPVSGSSGHNVVADTPKAGERHTRAQAEADLIMLTRLGTVPVERRLAERWGLSLSYTQQIIAGVELQGLIKTHRSGRRLAYELA
jgi:hypothetical protein